MNVLAATIPVGTAVFWGVVTFSLLVVLHEGGHFLAAKAFGVRVHEFMIGLPGPALRFKPKRTETTFGITAIPLGGYVRIAGMEPGAEDPLLGEAFKRLAIAGRMDARSLAAELSIDRDRATGLLLTLADYMAADPADDDEISYVSRYPATDADDPEALLAPVRARTYRGRKPWQRMVMLSAGVTVNLVSAILTFTIVLAAWGYMMPTLTLSTVQPGTAAAAAGLKAGDRLARVGTTRLTSWDDLLKVLATAKIGETLDIGYVRADVAHDAVAVVGSNAGKPYLGVGASLVNRRVPVFAAFGDSLMLTGQVFVAIAGFFRPSTFQQSVAGARSVIGISEEVAKAAKAGPLDYAWLVALLSLSLGALNILPIPPLDGGKVAMEIVEALAGRPIRRRLSIAISVLGAALLFSLIGYLMYADVMRYIVNKG